MTDKITIDVDGQRYDGWESVEVSRSLENLCGTFKFTASHLVNETFPIKRMQGCKIFVNNELVLTGYIDTITDDLSSDDHSITVDGRDITADIVDSKIDAPDIKPPLTIEHALSTILKQLNLQNRIKIINPYSIGKIEQLHASEDAESAFDIMSKIAAKKSVLITTNSAGNLVLARASTEVMKTVLTVEPGKSNIIKRSVKYDDSKRYNKYKLKIQENLLSLSLVNHHLVAKNVAGSNKIVFDNEIRNSRILVFHPDDDAHDNSNTGDDADSGDGTSSTDYSEQDISEAKDRVAWEKNFRKAKSFSYNCTVQGFIAYNDNALWKLNKLIKVIDNRADINATLLINTITFKQDVDSGTITELELVIRDAFVAELQESSMKSKKNKKDDDIGNNIFSTLARKVGLKKANDVKTLVKEND